MNGLLLLAIAAALLLTAYLVYGRYLVKKHGELIQKLRHLLMKKKMELIMFQVINGKYLDTNSLQLPEPVQ